MPQPRDAAFTVSSCKGGVTGAPHMAQVRGVFVKMPHRRTTGLLEQKGHPRSVTVRGQHGADGGVDSAVRAAVEAFGKVLGEVLELVMGCQEVANDMCLCCTCTSGKLSKQSS